MNRSRHAILVPLLAVLAVLLGLAETASAAFNPAAQNPHYGNFILQQSEASAGWPLDIADPTKGNGEWIYDSASGVPAYVRQNPWTMFDPLGLAEFRIGPVYFMLFQDGVMGTCRMAGAGDSHVPQVLSLDGARARVGEFKASPARFAKDVAGGYMNPGSPPSSMAGQSGAILATGEALVSLGRNVRIPQGPAPATATANGAVVQGNGTAVATLPSLPAAAVLQNNQDSQPEGQSPRDTTEANATNSAKPKLKAKERRAQEQAESREKKHGDADYEEPASEDYAKWKAKELEQAQGKDARRAAHDKKTDGIDRSKRQLDEDYEG